MTAVDRLAEIQARADNATDVPALVAAVHRVLAACESYERAQGLYRVEVGQREIIRAVRAEINAALGEVQR